MDRYLLDRPNVHEPPELLVVALEGALPPDLEPGVGCGVGVGVPEELVSGAAGTPDDALPEAPTADLRFC